MFLCSGLGTVRLSRFPPCHWQSVNLAVRKKVCVQFGTGVPAGDPSFVTPKIVAYFGCLVPKIVANTKVVTLIDKFRRDVAYLREWTLSLTLMHVSISVFLSVCLVCLSLSFSLSLSLSLCIYYPVHTEPVHYKQYINTKVMHRFENTLLCHAYSIRVSCTRPRKRHYHTSSANSTFALFLTAWRIQSHKSYVSLFNTQIPCQLKH